VTPTLTVTPTPTSSIVGGSPWKPVKDG
jgi:hypothetical protein